MTFGSVLRSTSVYSHIFKKKKKDKPTGQEVCPLYTALWCVVSLCLFYMLHQEIPKGYVLD